MWVVHNPDHQRHKPRWEFHLGTEIYRTRDVPERAELIRAAVEADETFAFTPAVAHDAALMRELHPYHDDLKTICDGITDDKTELYPDLFPGEGARFRRKPHPLWLGLYCTDCVSPLLRGTYAAAKGSVDTALTGADRLLANPKEAVYSLCRPSGHHAGPRVFGGYCYFNNSSLAAAHLARQSGKRVALLDIDFHHGNGSQELFWTNPRIFTASIHCDPDVEYPYYTGYRDEVGEGAGAGTNLNLPLPKSTTLPGYRAAIAEFRAAMDRYQPDYLVIAAGFDAHRADPVGAFQLDTPDFKTIGADLAAIGVPTLICQEGGYALEVLGPTVHTFLKAFQG
jgi:acetoin utilization deacetylase AcuC-like enzyme